MNNYLCIIISVMIFMTACSIKEDREKCPCILTIDISGCHEWSDDLSLKGWKGSKSLFGMSASAKDFPGGISITVPKGAVSYFARSPLEHSRQEGRIVSIKEGNESDPLFAYRTSLVADNEEMYDKVVMHKQFANFNISFAHKDGFEAGVDSVIISAQYSGLNLEDLSPVKGSFNFVSAGSDGFFSIRIPRQEEDSAIEIDIMHDGEVLREIDLSSLLSEKGYSWKDEDLDDVWLDFDIGKSSVKVGFTEWEDGVCYKKNI